MPSSIHNFFDFLEKKTGKTLSPDAKFDMKSQHAKELIDDKDIDALSLERKMIHYPERISKKDLVVEGNFTLPDEVRKIPEGLVVKGVLRVVGDLDKTTNNVQATSVYWNASSDYYPRSFNGATFKYFNTVSNKQAKKLPDNCKVIDKIRIEHSTVEILPEGLKTDYINALNSELQKLPATLECNELNIQNTTVTEIPQGVVVHKILSISKIPKKYPQHLEDVIAIKGGATIGEMREFEKLPQIVATVGRKTKKGKGIVVPLSDIGSKQVTEFLEKFKQWYSSVDQEIKTVIETVEGVDKVFGIKIDTAYLFVKHDYFFQLSYVLKGKTKEGNEILVTDEALISAYGQASTKNIKYSWNPTERQVKDIQDKLYPQTDNTAGKAINIRTLMNGPQSKEEFWKIGRKQRGGHGIQGKAKDLIPSLSGVSQDNMVRYAKRAGVTWGDMMVFDNNGAINVIAKSNEKDQDGNFTYFDKYGYGQGGGSRIFTGPDYTVS